MYPVFTVTVGRIGSLLLRPLSVERYHFQLVDSTLALEASFCLWLRYLGLAVAVGFSLVRDLHLRVVSHQLEAMNVADGAVVELFINERGKYSDFCRPQLQKFRPF